MILAVAALGVTGCGGAGRTGLTPVEQNELLGLIAQARAAAASGDVTGAETVLGKLRTTVSGLRVAGALDPGRAARMQSVAAQAISAARAGTGRAPAAGSAGSPASRSATTTPAATAPAPPAAPVATTPAPPAAPVAVDRTPPARDRGGRQLNNLQKQLREQIKARAGQGQGKGD